MTHRCVASSSMRRQTILRLFFVALIAALCVLVSTHFEQKANANQSRTNVQSGRDRIHANSPLVVDSKLTGKGIVIGIYDGGLNLDSGAFENLDGTSRVISQLCVGESIEISSCESAPGRQANLSCSTKDVGCFHGMSVAGFAAGGIDSKIVSNKDIDLSGVAPEANISYVRESMDRVGTIKYYNFVKALGKFVQDVKNNSSSAPDVVNLSLSFPRSSYSDCEQDNEIKRSIDFLVENGVVVVAATGNNSDKSSITYPACMKNVIAVGSSTPAKVNNGVEQVSDFSNMSSEVDIVAPGENLYGLMPNGLDVVSVSGTSFAAPLVSGAIALIKQAEPDINQNEVRDLLFATGDDIKDPSNGQVFRKLNLESVFNQIVEKPVNSKKLIETPQPQANPSSAETKKVAVSSSAPEKLLKNVEAEDQKSRGNKHFQLNAVHVFMVIGALVLLFALKRGGTNSQLGLKDEQEVFDELESLEDLELSLLCIELEAIGSK